MQNLLTLFSNKISSYNLLNYFLPELLFCLIFKYIVGYNVIVGTNVENVFICYFVGMIIRRIGSLWLEKILKCSKFLVFDDYKDF